MPSDISRKIFDPRKHYSGVLQQQGRVQLDSDWNEQLDVYQYRLFTETVDVIGKAGVPKNINKGNSFKIFNASASDFSIGKGHAYVGGLLCELADDATYAKQPWFKNAPPLGTIGGADNANTLSAGAYIAYLVAWQREINFHDDPHIQEVALGGPDTTTRLQTVWQVKMLRVSDPNYVGLCTTDFAEWLSLITPSTGQLKARTQPSAATEGPCVLPPSAGYRRTENQLYRVEVHQGGANLAGTTFKWSRDNATVESVIRQTDGFKIYVDEIGKDDVLSFKVGDWVEIVYEVSDLNATPAPLVKITAIDPGARMITVNTAVTNGKVAPIKLRKWDQFSAAATANGVPATGGWLDLEDGVQVEFSAGSYKSGQYWLIPARTITGDIEWPRSTTNDPIAQAPLGIQYHYCRLALLKWNPQTMKIPQVLDCRPMFSPLTEQTDCECSITVKPGPGWEAVFNNIKQGQDAHLCFEPGEYPLSGPVSIDRKGHLKLSGAGRGSKILARNSEAALIFTSCPSVCVRDLYVETGITGSAKNTPVEKLNGGLNFLTCNEVQVDSVDFKNGAGGVRAATCLTIHTAKTARVMNCDFQVGHLQQGVLLVNVNHSMVQNNTLANYKSDIVLKPGDYTDLLTPEAIDLFFADLTRGRSKTKTRKATGRVKEDDAPDVKGVKAFNPISPLKGFSQILAKEEPPKDVSFAEWGRSRAMELLMSSENYIIENPAFGDYYANLTNRNETVAAQAITVGGTYAEHVHISNNVINDFLVGIHVGLSKQAPRDEHYHAKSVTISDNRVKIKLPLIGKKRTRHGIFVGNCKKMSIDNNYVTLLRFHATAKIEIDGIRAWGYFGPSLKIMHNVVSGEENNTGIKNHFSQGINIHPLNSIDLNANQWIAMWNVAPNSKGSVAVRTQINKVDLRITMDINASPTNIPV